MGSIFKGRAILPASIEGEALVTRAGFNAYASFFSSLHKQVEYAECVDSGNKELFGKNLTNKIICLPKTIGSTSAGAVWPRVAGFGVAPKAMLFSQEIDSLAAAGLIVAEKWGGTRICTVDQLGNQFLQAVKDGDHVEIRTDGTVILN